MYGNGLRYASPRVTVDEARNNMSWDGLQVCRGLVDGISVQRVRLIESHCVALLIGTTVVFFEPFWRTSFRGLGSIFNETRMLLLHKFFVDLISLVCFAFII